MKHLKAYLLIFSILILTSFRAYSQDEPYYGLIIQYKIIGI